MKILLQYVLLAFNKKYMTHEITLTDEQRVNLIKFLQRVQLTGEEVPAYVEIVAVLNKPLLEEMTKKVEEKDKI